MPEGIPLTPSSPVIDSTSQKMLFIELGQGVAKHVWVYPTIPYNTLQCLHYPIVVTNTVIRLVTQRPEAVASIVVDCQLTNQIPDLHYPTIPYNNFTIPYNTYNPTLPYSCNKYCDLIGHSVARGCSIPSKIKDRLLINQIPDLHYPTIPYNTL